MSYFVLPSLLFSLNVSLSSFITSAGEIRESEWINNLDTEYPSGLDSKKINVMTSIPAI